MKFLKRIWFYFLSFTMNIIGHAIGWIHAPWTHKLTCYADVLKIRAVIEDGDVIVDRTKGEFTTLVIPGFWKHAMVYVGDDFVVESTSKGVHKSYIADVIMKTDYFAVMRVKGLEKDIRKKIAERACTYIGRAYDFWMRLGNKKQMFCSEIVYAAVNETVGKEYIEHYDRMGFPSFTPDDCYNARKKFDLIIEKR